MRSANLLIERRVAARKRVSSSAVFTLRSWPPSLTQSRTLRTAWPTLSPVSHRA